MIKSLKIINLIALFLLLLAIGNFVLNVVYFEYHLYLLKGSVNCIENYPATPHFNVFLNSCTK